MYSIVGRSKWIAAAIALASISQIPASAENVDAMVDACAPGPININVHGLEPFESPPEVRSQDGELNIVLDVKYGTSEIAGCRITHRSYNGRFIGPTLRLKPGDVLNMTVRNMLPPNPDVMPADHNQPHHFNTTNIHTHGLHVDPKGISDNVLRRMTPGGEYQVRVEIPADHPPGTFWYHPHVHGSTAIQVASGMAGGLIIEGGLDDVQEIAAAKEHVMLLQQIPYDENGEIDDFALVDGVALWYRELKRHMTINGQLVPSITMRPGEVRRFRFISGFWGIPVDISLDGHKLLEIATDGIALGKCNPWDSLGLWEGQRSDVLVKARPLEDGETRAVYWLRELAILRGDRSDDEEDPRQYIARIVVEGEPMEMELPCNSGQLADLVPFEPITDEEIEGKQQMMFSVMADEDGVKRYMVDGKVFGEGEVRTLKLGSVEEWTVGVEPESLERFHPFHIHVNSFQVTRDDPFGNPEIIWRDTLGLTTRGTRKLRMRYEDFHGKFVLHCHILNHEDRGMMQVVEIVE
ncbi:MAG: copper oxidase [Sphingomonadales bacterium]|nr:MAG: copper oxidase [Sphingomonadales bacterium]